MCLLIRATLHLFSKLPFQNCVIFSFSTRQILGPFILDLEPVATLSSPGLLLHNTRARVRSFVRSFSFPAFVFCLLYSSYYLFVYLLVTTFNIRLIFGKISRSTRGEIVRKEEEEEEDKTYYLISRV